MLPLHLLGLLDERLPEELPGDVLHDAARLLQALIHRHRAHLCGRRVAASVLLYVKSNECICGTLRNIMVHEHESNSNDERFAVVCMRLNECILQAGAGAPGRGSCA